VNLYTSVVAALTARRRGRPRTGRELNFAGGLVLTVAAGTAANAVVPQSVGNAEDVIGGATHRRTDDDRLPAVSPRRALTG
jgi:hypothetical protein